MKEFIRVTLVLFLLIAGFAVGFFFPRKSYIVVQPNWIRAENASFTVEVTDVTCNGFTINVLGFYAESIAEEVAKAPWDYSELYESLLLRIDHPANLQKINEEKAPFGYLAVYQRETYSVHPRFNDGEKYHLAIKVVFSKFANIHEAVPFELDLLPTNCL